MNARFLTLLAGAFGAGLLAISVSAAEPQATETPADSNGIFDQEAAIRATDDNAAQAGVQPQGRGQVHEAFAEATSERPPASPVVPKAPPEAVEEMPPADKPEGDDVQWISGYWAYDEERSDFLWITGIWRSIPPGRQWVPGHWAKVDGGYQWVAGFWAASDAGDVAVVPAPPEPEPETPPPAPSEDSTFVPGTQVYQKETNQFVWQPGYYVTYRPGWVWVPAHYIWTPVGYIFVDGYWDYDVQKRGLLFAPVVIQAQYLTQPNWVYTPSYVVHDVCLLDSLFVRRDCGCYFFGDYFDSGYSQLGYVSWADYRFGRHGYDPLFGYYRWLHRNDNHWEKDLRGLYTARSKNQAARPPRNLLQQQTLAKNLLAGNRLNATTLHHNVMLAPVSKLDRKVVKVQTLDQSTQLKFRKTADQFRTVSRQREQVENKLVAQGITAGRKTGTQTLQLNLPKNNGGINGGIKLNTGKTPPPPPPFKRIERTNSNTDVRLGKITDGQGGLKVNGNGGNGNNNQNGNAGGKTNGNGNGPLKINNLPGNTGIIRNEGKNDGKTDVKNDAKVGNIGGAQGGKVTLPGGTNLPGKPNGGNNDVKTDRIDRTNRNLPPFGNNGGNNGNGGNGGNNGGNGGNKPSGGNKIQGLPGGNGGNGSGFKSERIERNDRIERTTGNVNFQSSGNNGGRIGSTNFESTTTRFQSNQTPVRVLSDGGNSFGRTNNNFTQQTFTGNTQRFTSGPSNSSGPSGLSGSSFRNSSGGGSGGGRRR